MISELFHHEEENPNPEPGQFIILAGAVVIALLKIFGL